MANEKMRILTITHLGTKVASLEVTLVLRTQNVEAPTPVRGHLSIGICTLLNSLREAFENYNDEIQTGLPPAKA